VCAVDQVEGFLLAGWWDCCSREKKHSSGGKKYIQANFILAFFM
jgi:hypothetical protein